MSSSEKGGFPMQLSQFSCKHFLSLHFHVWGDNSMLFRTIFFPCLAFVITFCDCIQYQFQGAHFSYLYKAYTMLDRPSVLSMMLYSKITLLHFRVYTQQRQVTELSPKGWDRFVVFQQSWHMLMGYFVLWMYVWSAVRAMSAKRYGGHPPVICVYIFFLTLSGCCHPCRKVKKTIYRFSKSQTARCQCSRYKLSRGKNPNYVIV